MPHPDIAMSANSGSDGLSAGIRPSGPSRETAQLNRALVQGIAWTGGVKWGGQILSWVSTLVVARLLAPSDYGLIGMAMVFMGFVTLVNEFGLGAAIIARRDLSEDHISQLNGFSVLLGLGSVAVTALAAVPLSLFFGVPELRWVVVAMSGVFVLSSLRTVPASLLERDMHFKTTALIEGGQAVGQAMSVVLLAWVGFGYWALVGGTLIGAAVSSGAVLAMRRHRFAWPRLKAIKGALTMSWHLLMTRLCWFASANSDMMVAGRVLGQAALGAYTLGWTIAMVPVEKVSSLVVRIAYPLFSSLQNDLAAIRHYLLVLTEGLALVTFPVACGLAMVAENFVALALGSKWHDAVLPLQLLAAFTAMRSVTPLLPHILNVTGGSRFGMYVGFWTALIGPPLFYAGSWWGLGGIALAWVIVHPLAMAPVYWRVLPVIELPVHRYLVALAPAVTGSVLMVISMWGASTVMPAAWPLAAHLGVEVAVGGIVYAGATVLFHLERLRAFVQLVKSARA